MVRQLRLPQYGQLNCRGAAPRPAAASLSAVSMLLWKLWYISTSLQYSTVQYSTVWYISTSLGAEWSLHFQRVLDRGATNTYSHIRSPPEEPHLA